MRGMAFRPDPATRRCWPAARICASPTAAPRIQRRDRAQETVGVDALPPARRTREAQLEMGEAVPHLAGRAPGGAHRRVAQRLLGRPRGRRARPCRAARSCRPAGRAAGGGAAARCRPRRSARNARRGAAAATRLRRPARQVGGNAGRRPAQAATPRAQRAGRAAGVQTRRAKVEQRLGEVGRPRVAPRVGCRARRRAACDRRLGGGQRRVDGKQPGGDPLDVAVHRHRRQRRTRSRRSRPRCRGRCRAARAARRCRAGTRRPPPPPGRRRAGCAPARSSRARPRRRAPRPAAPRPAPRRRGSG